MNAWRPLTVLGLTLLLGGCGFHPLYAIPGKGKGAMRAEMQSVYVPPVADAQGYGLRDTLIDVLDGQSDPKAARYRLTVTIKSDPQAIGLQSQKVGTLSQTTITRYNNHLTVEYQLSDAKNGAVLTKGIELGLSSYNVLPSPYATLVAQQDADKHTLDDIAYRIRIALAAYFSQQK